MEFNFTNSKNITGCVYGFIPDYKDERGVFFKPFSELILRQLNIKFDIVETYVSTSHKNVFRGMHLQIPPYDHDKLVILLAGEVDDYIIDLRKTSNFGKSEKVCLELTKQNFIYIPRGVAHGFHSKQDNSTLLYMTNSSYVPEFDTGVNITEINFFGSKTNLKMSHRDIHLPTLNSFKKSYLNK
jgi:dTDP-4-dehydrorhamnose 3,5-epimerase/CDP-3, 6-dideoxy-D-glycero-D-glycero-4-hexulose-5-epimerase